MTIFKSEFSWLILQTNLLPALPCFFNNEVANLLNDINISVPGLITNKEALVFRTFDQSSNFTIERLNTLVADTFAIEFRHYSMIYTLTPGIEYTHFVYFIIVSAPAKDQNLFICYLAYDRVNTSVHGSNRDFYTLPSDILFSVQEKSSAETFDCVKNLVAILATEDINFVPVGAATSISPWLQHWWSLIPFVSFRFVIIDFLLSLACCLKDHIVFVVYKACAPSGAWSRCFFKFSDVARFEIAVKGPFLWIIFQGIYLWSAKLYRQLTLELKLFGLDILHLLCFYV